MVIGETERERDILTARRAMTQHRQMPECAADVEEDIIQLRKKKKKKRVGSMTEIKRGFLCLSLSASLPPFSLPLKFWADTNP